MKRIPAIAFALLCTSILFVLYTSCSPKKNKCTVCSNGGICQNDTCLCPLGYTGAHCETPPDPCASVTCQNGGTCNAGVCTCPTGYEGTYCETLSKSRILGTWHVAEHGSNSSPANYSIRITAGAGTAPSEVFITNFYNYFTQAVKANVLLDKLFIPSQYLYGKLVFGNGYIHATSIYGLYGYITVAYEVIDTATNIPDDFGYVPDGSRPSEWNK